MQCWTEGALQGKVLRRNFFGPELSQGTTLCRIPWHQGRMPWGDTLFFPWQTKTTLVLLFFFFFHGVICCACILARLPAAAKFTLTRFSGYHCCSVGNKAKCPSIRQASHQRCYKGEISFQRQRNESTEDFPTETEKLECSAGVPSSLGIQMGVNAVYWHRWSCSPRISFHQFICLRLQYCSSEPMPSCSAKEQNSAYCLSLKYKWLFQSLSIVFRQHSERKIHFQHT